MTKSATRIQDKDSLRRLSVVQSTDDPTKFWIVILNPDWTPIGTWGWGWEWNVKAFYLSSTSDTTNAQRAYNWYAGGKNPIVVYNNKPYTLKSADASSMVFVMNEVIWDDKTSYSTVEDVTISFALSSWNVQSITTGGNVIASMLKVGYNYGTPYSPEYNGSPATKKYVDDTAWGKVLDLAYSQANWDWETTKSPSADKLYDKIDSIDWVIPSAATVSNQLADKDYVNDSINSITAYYITKDVQGDQFATYLELSTAVTFYSGGVARTPTRNDYCIVVADENHDNATTRYIYQNNQWEYQYTVNETALTTAQLNALNSWITSAKVSSYDWYASSKQDALTLPATPTSGHLVVWWGNNKTFTDWGDVPTWVPSGGTDWQVLGKVSGNVAWVNPSGWDVVVSSQANNILTTGMKIWAGTQADYENLWSYDSNTLYLTVE